MLDWGYEGRPIVYAALAVAAVALLVLWWQSRKRGLLIAAGVMLALIGLYALLDRLVETDREQITRKVETMAAAITARNVDRAFENISDSFQTPRGTDKKALRAVAQSYVDNGTVTSVEVWEIRVGSISPAEGRALVSFRVKVKPVQNVDLRCDAVFDHDPAKGWRLREFRLFNPYRDEEWPTPF